jgi:tetratricopeptide (TPR) repeat protein
MRKSRWLSWLSNDLPDYLLFVVGVICLFVGLAGFAHTFYLYEQAETRHLTIGTFWWFERITRIIWSLSFALLMILWWYEIQLRKKVETIEQASQMRKIVYAVWWATILALALVAERVFATLYHKPSKPIFDLIILLPLGIFLIFGLVNSQAKLRYCRKQPFCNIAAACLLERHTKFLHERDFDKSYNALVKACEIAPEETFLWCHLAHFCELFRNNTTESDKYMAKAKELISTKKVDSDSNKACYFNYLGMILYDRGEYEKGLEYMKKSIDIGPNPGRIKTYEKKLSEFKAKQQNTQL